MARPTAATVGRKHTARPGGAGDRRPHQTARELQVAVGTDHVLAAWIQTGVRW